ncbi:tyrosine-type recombinase/integrase [Bacillus sp. JJ722]|uniref:tyrosine-type recombinase/integrase n=1 Tax=Bacillus sp. JJ722 TaxID=3122973 RepID=UPI002FFFCBDB
MAKGSIRRRGTRYQITVDVGIDEFTGKRKRHYESFDSEKEAMIALEDIKRKVDAGTYLKETDDTFEEFMRNWFSSNKRMLRQNTLYTYERYLNILYPYLPVINAKEVTKAHAESILEKLSEKYKSSTVAVFRRLMSTAFNYYIRKEVVAKNPFHGIRVKRETRNYTIWKPEQVATFLEHMRTRGANRHGNRAYYMAFQIALRTGMRKSEILGLRWQNVSLDDGMIFVRETLHQTNSNGEKFVAPTKSKAGMRSVAIDKTLVEELRNYREYQLDQAREKDAEQLIQAPNDYVITTVDFNTMHPRNLTSILFKAIKETGLPRLRFHDLRHTHASLLLANGISAKVIQERLGHARIETTINTYSHLFPSMQVEAARKIDELFE